MISLRDYGMTFDNIGWINFEVQGCRDAYLKLQTTTQSDDDSYELALGIGVNTWFSLYKYMAGKQSIFLWQSAPTLDCDNYIAYWLGWKDNTLSFGSGFVYGENVIRSKDDITPHDIVNIIMYSGSTVQWNFVQGKQFSKSSIVCFLVLFYFCINCSMSR